MNSTTRIDGNRINALGRLLADARLRFGVTRIEIGAILCTVSDEELWQGRAQSFREYLAAENIRPEQARSYMKVARKVFHELEMPDLHINRLARMSMKTLEKAVDLMDRHNALDLNARGLAGLYPPSHFRQFSLEMLLSANTLGGRIDRFKHSLGAHVRNTS